MDQILSEPPFSEHQYKEKYNLWLQKSLSYTFLYYYSKNNHLMSNSLVFTGPFFVSISSGNKKLKKYCFLFLKNYEFQIYWLLENPLTPSWDCKWSNWKPDPSVGTSCGAIRSCLTGFFYIFTLYIYYMLCCRGHTKKKRQYYR